MNVTLLESAMRRSYFTENPLDRFLAEGRFMPRIPEAELDRLKGEVSPVQLIESQDMI